MYTIFDALKSIKFNNNLPFQEARLDADNQLKASVTDRSVRDFLLTNLIQTSDSRFVFITLQIYSLLLNIFKFDYSYGWRVNLTALQNSFLTHITQFPPDAVNLKYNGPVLFIGGANSDYLR